MRKDKAINDVQCLECRSYSLVHWKPTDKNCKCLECNTEYGMDFIQFVREGGLE
jgi:hypothetical protein